MAQHTCFVISPIGKENSPIREGADSVFDLLVEPALQKFNFKVIRADKIGTPGTITTEMIELIQSSEICIADLTGHNANVMYEVGRRHETAKPCIMIARRGEELPFDLGNVRTFFYSLDTPREMLDSQRLLQGVVSAISDAGFEAGGKVVSISSLAEILRRIERKLDATHSSSGVARSHESTSPSAAELIKKVGVVDAINLAISQRDVDLIDQLLPRAAGRVNHENFVLGGLCQGSILGSRVAIDLLEPELKNLDAYEEEKKRRVVGSYVSGVHRTDQEERGLGALRDLFSEVQASRHNSEFSSEDKAFYLNQYQRLLHGNGDAEAAARIGEDVLEFAPDDPSYLFNQSINCEQIGNIDRAHELIDRYMALMASEFEEVPDDDHVRRAVNFYSKLKQKQKAISAFKLLQRHHPIVAQVVQEADEVSEMLR
jgi:hypothetical protein